VLKVESVICTLTLEAMKKAQRALREQRSPFMREWWVLADR
jgi:hypothetical protein